MLADIQSQIELIDDQTAFPECYDMTSEDVNEVQRRKRILETVASAPCSQIDEAAINLVYGR